MNAYEPIVEYRPDGWPLCPYCGEDEVMSWLDEQYVMAYFDQHSTHPPLQDYLNSELLCLACGWARPERKAEAKP